MKNLLFLSSCLLVISCGPTRLRPTQVKNVGTVDLTQYLNTITANELQKHLYIVAADSMQGRDTGSESQKKQVTI